METPNWAWFVACWPHPSYCQDATYARETSIAPSSVRTGGLDLPLDVAKNMRQFGKFDLNKWTGSRDMEVS